MINYITCFKQNCIYEKNTKCIKRKVIVGTSLKCLSYKKRK